MPNVLPMLVDGVLDILVMISDAELEEMRQHNPVSIDIRLLPVASGAVVFRGLAIVVANDEDIAEVIRLSRAGAPLDAVRYACRGYRKLPGDEQPVVSLKTPKGEA